MKSTGGAESNSAEWLYLPIIGASDTDLLNPHSHSRWKSSTLVHQKSKTKFPWEIFEIHTKMIRNEKCKYYSIGLINDLHWTRLFSDSVITVKLWSNMIIEQHQRRITYHKHYMRQPPTWLYVSKSVRGWYFHCSKIPIDRTTDCNTL